jgi:hypothetical protein
MRVNQRDLLWKEPVFMDQVPKSRATGVRAPVVAMSLVTEMERRERRKVDSDSAERGRQYQCECPKGLSELERLRLTLRSGPNEC